MKLMKIIVYIVFFGVVSCSISERNRVCSEESESSCSPIILNLKSKYMFSRIDEYFVWKKYGVEIVRDLEFTFTDSCQYNNMRAKLVEEKGIGVIDSIVNYINNKTSNKVKQKRSLSFFDGSYSSILNSKLINGKGAVVKEPSVFYNKIDSLGSVVSKVNTTISFWLTINKQGELENIEIVNSYCLDSLDLYSVINTSLKDVHWEPAFFQGDYVKYKYKEIIVPIYSPARTSY